MLIKQCFVNEWFIGINNLNENPIMRTYNIFKHEFGMEPYLLKVSNFKYRNAITKLRTSSHDLMIEIGRRGVTRLPQEQRLCKICNVIEDESHFLLSCRLFNTERERLLNGLNLRNFNSNMAALWDF